ncbi:restriction endonuclease subunit S [Vibrio cholerae]|nr:restriction endonuclease subunit S [Vibrio cholerae]
MVPKGWDALNLKNVAQKIQDGNYGADYPKADELVASGIPFLTSKVIGGNGTVNQDKFDYISEEKHQKLKKAQITSGDILFTNRGANVGTIAITPDYLSDGNIGPQLTLIRCNEKIEKDFLFQFLRGSFFQKQVCQQDSGSAMNFFGIKDTERFKILVPPLPEQKKIAQILSTWDKAIITTEQLLANSQQQKKALMQQLLTGKKRLLDENGVRFSGEWKSYHLSYVAVIVMGSSPKSEAYNEHGIGLPLLQGNADIKNRISVPRVFTSEITKECEIGDILLSVRAPVGTVAISEHKACIGRGIAALHAKPNFDQSFIYQFLLWFEPKWGSLSQGSTFESINSDDIKNLKIKVPNFGEQQKIAAVLSTADQEISALQQKLDALKQEKKALMQQLLTGKRRVKIDNKEVA